MTKTELEAACHLLLELRQVDRDILEIKEATRIDIYSPYVKICTINKQIILDELEKKRKELEDKLSLYIME